MDELHVWVLNSALCFFSAFAHVAVCGTGILVLLHWLQMFIHECSCYSASIQQVLS